MKENFKVICNKCGPDDCMIDHEVEYDSYFDEIEDVEVLVYIQCRKCWDKEYVKYWD